MSYATLDNFKERLGTSIYAQLTDRVTRKTADDVVGQAILDGAHGTIDGYLARRFKVPVDPTGDTSLTQFLLKHVLNLAAYDAWEGSPFITEVPDRVKFSYQETVKLLRDIAAGKVELPGATAIPSATAAGPTATATGEDRIFTEDAMKGL